jgi:hypothetical protein
MLISGALFVTPVNDTVWWNTPGGKVTGHSDPTASRCSLMLYNSDGSVSFEWDDQGRIFVIVTDQNWQFPDNSKVAVTMQLGNVSLTNRDGSAAIEAVGHGNAVGFVTDNAVDDLLRPANHIVVRTTNTKLLIKLTQAKMGVLLSRTRKCRDTIRK